MGYSPPLRAASIVDFNTEVNSIAKSLDITSVMDNDNWELLEENTGQSSLVSDPRSGIYLIELSTGTSHILRIYYTPSAASGNNKPGVYDTQNNQQFFEITTGGHFMFNVRCLASTMNIETFLTAGSGLGSVPLISKLWRLVE